MPEKVLNILLSSLRLSQKQIFLGKNKSLEKKKKKYNGQRIQDFSELSIGDYVVHEKHGLGIYKGIEKVEVDKIVKDYIKIEYRGGSNLYILATQLDALQKYSGAEAARVPRLNLSGAEMEKDKNKGKRRCSEYSKRASGALCGARGKGRLCVRPGYCMAERV